MLHNKKYLRIPLLNSKPETSRRKNIEDLFNERLIMKEEIMERATDIPPALQVIVRYFENWEYKNKKLKVHFEFVKNDNCPGFRFVEKKRRTFENFKISTETIFVYEFGPQVDIIALLNHLVEKVPRNFLCGSHSHYSVRRFTSKHIPALLKKEEIIKMIEKNKDYIKDYHLKTQALIADLRKLPEEQLKKLDDLVYKKKHRAILKKLKKLRVGIPELLKKKPLDIIVGAGVSPVIATIRKEGEKISITPENTDFPVEACIRYAYTKEFKKNMPDINDYIDAAGKVLKILLDGKYFSDDELHQLYNYTQFEREGSLLSWLYKTEKLVKKPFFIYRPLELFFNWKDFSASLAFYPRKMLRLLQESHQGDILKTIIAQAHLRRDIYGKVSLVRKRPFSNNL